MESTFTPSARQPYTAPSLSVIGPVATLTLTLKKFGVSDGFTFLGAPIANASA